MEPRTGRRPRVALVAHEVSGEQGSGRVIRELVLRASDRVDFVVVARELAEELRPLVEWRRVRAPANPYRTKAAAFFVLGAIEIARARADLVHLHTIGPLVPNRCDLNTAHFIRAGFFEAAGIFGPDGLPPVRRLSPRAHLALERWCNRRARLLAAVSEGSKRDLERLFPGVPVVVTPNGVDAERFAPDPASREELRRAEGVGPDEIVALVVANSWSQKGVGVAIEALGATTVRLWVVGYGDAEGYGARAAETGVGGRVRFFGTQTHVAPFYRAADVFLLPSLYEQASLAACEAAASGLPLVVTPVSGMEELVGAEEGGLLVERTPAAVAQALSRLAGNPELRARMGEAARSRALELTWEQTVESILAAYERLLGKPL